ncbi:MAG: tetratricopeptide repeat protein, partial [Terriglobales bacterium]
MRLRFHNGTRFLRYLAVLIVTATFLAAADQASPQAELESRMRAAVEARGAGDPVAVSQANRRLIAFALAQVAEMHLAQGDASGASGLYSHSLEFEDNADSRLQYAIALSSSAQVDAALKQVSALLDQDPNNAALWGMKGKLLTTKKSYREAVDAFTKSLQLKADPETAYIMAGDLLFLRETEKADAVFEQLAKAGINPARVHVMAGRAYEEADLGDGAVREYKKAIELDPKSHGHYFLGLYYLSHNGWENTPQAREEFAAEVAANPTDFFGNYFLGYLASNDKDYETSDRYLKVAAEARPDWPEAYLYLGLNAYGRGDNRAAEELLRKAIKLTGDQESRNNYQIRRAYFTLGRILIQTGRKDEGTKLVEKSKAMETKLVVDSRPQALDTKTASSESAMQSPNAVASGSIGATLTDAQKSQIANAEKSLGTILGNAYNDLGTSEARREDYATALVHFHQAEKWNPDVPGLHRNIGLAGFLSGNYADAAPAFRTVVERDPSDKRSLSMLAMSLYMLKDYPEAAKIFDRIPDEALADPRMSFAWAYTLSETKNPERAAEVLGKL